ncbi:unnamed protein product [Sphagnum balticum]
MCQLPIEIMSNDLDVDLPNNLRDLILTTTFWKGVAAVEVIFNVICSCLAYLEGDESTFSSVYAYFLAVAHHFRTLPPDVRAILDLSSADVDKMHTLVCHRLKTIFSPAHTLAFRTDPLFDDLRNNLAKLHRDAFLNLGDLTVLQQCKNAIKRMAAADVLLNRTMQSKFGIYTIRVEDDDDDFADIFSMPQQCGRWQTTRCKVKAGTAIVFNAQQLTRRASVGRNGPFVRWLRKLGVDAADAARIDEENNEQQDPAEGPCRRSSGKQPGRPP